MARTILHVDMDEFFAAVEKLDNPALRARCILVGGDPAARGVVSTASYEARAFGCGSAMPMATAIRLCPQAVVLPVRGRRYRQVSERVFEVLERFSPRIEPLSIDEAFLDVTGCERLLGAPAEFARQLKDAIRAATGLTASVGVAPNKFLAKLASDLDKPDGLTVIAPDRVQAVLDPLPVDKLWGVGRAARRRLESYGISTIAQLRRAGPDWLARWLGSGGEELYRLACGHDERPVTPDAEAKSIGQEQTFPVDVAEPDELRRVLRGQVEQVARRLRRHGLAARTLTLKLRTGDFTTRTRSATLAAPTDVTDELLAAAEKLFAAWARKGLRPLRLIGATASGLGPAGGQQGLFPDPRRERGRRLDRTLDEIVDRFGRDAVRRGETGPREQR